MKPILKFIILAISIICSTTNVFSQEWYDLIHQEPVNIEAVKQKAEIYFDKTGRGKHTGYKQYNRWLEGATMNMDKNGVPYTYNHVADELKKFRANASNRSGKTLASNANANADADGTWTVMGPFYTDQNNKDAKKMARIDALAIEPIQQQLLFAGSPGSGIWRSRDAGASWTPLGDQFDVMYVKAIALDPHNVNHVVYLNGNGVLFESFNQGDTWSQVKDLNTGVINNTHMISFHPTTPNIYFVSCAEGLMKTTNGGTSFSKVISGEMMDVFFKPGDPTTMYSAGKDFWKSTDTGATWTKITDGINASDLMKIAVTPADPNRVYILQADGGAFRKIYKSTNSGTSFTVQAEADNVPDNFLGKQAWRCMTIMGSITDPDRLDMGGLLHYRSDDGGATLYEVPGSNLTSEPADIHADVLTMQNINGTLYATSDGGIFRSTDNGVSYTPLTGNGLVATEIFRMGGSSPFPGTGENVDPHMVVIGCQDNGTSISKGADNIWEYWGAGDGMECFIDYTDDQIIYGSSQNSIIYSDDGGMLRNVLTRPENRPGFITPPPYAMDPIIHTSIYWGYRNLYISKNTGQDWENMTAGYTTDETYIKGVAIAPTDNNYIYFHENYRLWKSSNAQSNSREWTEIGDFTDLRINYITIDPDDPLHVLTANTGSEIFETKDGGETWADISGNLPDIKANCVLMDNSPENTIYVGMLQGVYYKNDNMTEWKLFGNGLPNADVTELEVHYASKKLRVATFGRGIWEIPIFGSESTTPTPVSSLTASSLNEFAAEGNSQLITVTSNIDWSVSENSSWITVDTTSESDNGSIEVTTTENTSTEDRSATITIAGGEISRSVSVSQIGATVEETSYVSIPTFIEAEDYDAQSGIRTENTEDINGGENVGHIDTGDFLAYNINVPNAGAYAVDFRIASRSNGTSFDIYSGDSVVGNVSNGATGNWQIWETASEIVTLPQGDQTIRLVATGTGWNINWLEFSEVESIAVDSCVKGTNLALNGSIIDFSTEQNSVNVVGNLIDGVDTNRWSANTFPQYAVVDLGDEYAVNEINLATFQNRAYQFIVEGSISATSDFSTLVNATNNADEGTINRTFSPQTVRYVKLTIIGANTYTGSWSSIADFKIICGGSNTNDKGLAANLFEVTVYPNPLTDTMTVTASNEGQKIGSIRLTDLTGRLILEKRVNASTYTLNNLDTVASGVYLLQINEAEDQISKTIKVVIE